MVLTRKESRHLSNTITPSHTASHQHIHCLPGVIPFRITSLGHTHLSFQQVTLGTLYETVNSSPVSLTFPSLSPSDLLLVGESSNVPCSPSLPVSSPLLFLRAFTHLFHYSSFLSLVFFFLLPPPSSLLPPALLYTLIPPATFCTESDFFCISSSSLSPSPFSSSSPSSPSSSLSLSLPPTPPFLFLHPLPSQGGSKLLYLCILGV